jgi:hypothetical protein
VTAFALVFSGCGARKTGGTTNVPTPTPGGTRHLVVAANTQVTLVGAYKAGQKVDIEAKGGSWSAGPGKPSVGAAGQTDAVCIGDDAHHCIAGTPPAPWMSLVVLMTPCPVEQQGCFWFGRDAIATPVTITVPRDGYLYLAPNDWMEEVGDNTGALDVDVSP